MVTSNRLKWLDMVKGICVFSVLLAHCGIEHNYLQLVYTPFFLVLFFFISGYLFKEKGVKISLRKLSHSLVIPYFLLCTFIILIGIDNWQAIINGNYSLILNRFKRVLLGYDLWFISCIIMVQLYYIFLSHLYMKSIRSKVITASIFLLSVYIIENDNSHTLPYYCDIALFALPFFIAGNVVKELLPNEWHPLQNKKWISIVLIIIYLVISLTMQHIFDMEFHFAYNYYKSPILFIILACIGIIIISLFSQSYQWHFIEKLGQNSLIIFAFNGKAHAITTLVLNSLGISKIIGFNSYLHAIAFCILQSFVLFAIAYTINNYVPFLIGEKKKKKYDENIITKPTYL